MNIERRYIVDEQNRRVAVQLDIKTFERIERALEDFALANMIREDDDAELLDLDQARIYYEALPKAR